MGSEQGLGAQLPVVSPMGAPGIIVAGASVVTGSSVVLVVTDSVGFSVGGVEGNWTSEAVRKQ